MPHNISKDPLSNQYSMMYVGDPPWHNLGIALKNPPTSKEAIQVAHLDWDVEKYSISVVSPFNEIHIPDKYAIMRTDLWYEGNAPCFGVVGPDYQPLQNSTAFEFFDDLVKSGDVTYDTAGALGDGERVWILAKAKCDMRIVSDDICQPYLLLSNSHDGQSSLQVKFTPIRVVCQNTLSMALYQGPDLFRYAHNRSISNRMEMAKEMVGLIFAQFKRMEEAFQAMAHVRMNDNKLDQYYRLVFPDPRDTNNLGLVERATRNREQAKRSSELGAGNSLEGVAGTLWAAYNGVTWWIDHGSTTKEDERHLNSIWFGDGYQVKARAYRLAVENLKTWAG